MGQAWCRERGEGERRPSVDGIAYKPVHSSALQPSTGQTMAEAKNYFGPVNLGPLDYQIILVFPESSMLGSSLVQQCDGLPCKHTVVRSPDEAWKLVVHLNSQAVIIMGVVLGEREGVEGLLKNIITHQLDSLVTVVAVMSASERLSKESSHLLDCGVSRVLTVADCSRVAFPQHLLQIERTEVKLKHQLLFGNALLSAIEQSYDAIQITDSQNKIMFVNTSFVNLTGYSQEESLGRQSVDLVKANEDQRTENGPSSILANKKWDGECMGRRKSGTTLRQHLKLIPVSLTPDQVSSRPVYHVIIQRLVGALEDGHKHILEGRRGSCSPKAPHAQISSSRGLLIKTQTLPTLRIPHPHVNTPLAMVLHSLMRARDSQDCPSKIKEEIEGAMEVLRTTELYTPQSDDLSRSKGIVQGLLSQPTRRFTMSTVTEPPMRTVHPTSHLRHSPATPPPQQLQEALENINSWDFDIIHLEKVCQGSHRFGPLYYVGTQLFKDFDMAATLGVDEQVISSWMKLMETNYRVNPYHGSTHAADVLHATVHLIRLLQDNLASHGDLLDQAEIAAILISAVVHDLDHPGHTNPFLCNSKAELAMLYNDKSVLENHHVSLAFRLTEKDEQANIFQSLDTPTYRAMRLSIIDMVLATDMSRHFEHLTKFTTLNSRSDESGSNTSLSKGDSEGRMVMKKILVKCADISNPCRPIALCREWADRIAQEYFKQTEEERTLGLPIMFPDFDRNTCNIPSTQIKFIDFFITQLFESWDGYCPIPQLMNCLATNYDTWKREYESSQDTDEQLIV